MSDITVVAKVTPDTSSPTGFTWAYTPFGSEGSFTILAPGTIEIPKGTSPEITVNVVPGGETADTCVFQNNNQDPQQSPPLTFTDWQGNPVSNPQWYQELQFLDPSTILFTDDNTNLKTRNYYINVNVIYTSGDVSVPTSSPDPTIVNAGIDPGDGAVEAAPPQRESRPSAAAV